MKKSLAAAFLPLALSSLVSAQTPAQPEPVKTEPAPLAAKYAQPPEMKKSSGGGRYAAGLDARQTLNAWEMGMTAWARGRAEKMLGWLAEPSLDEHFYARGAAYYILGKYDDAIAEFDKAVRMNPFYVDAYSGRGRAYSGKGDYERAVADCERAVRLNPAYAPAYYDWARVYADKGDYARAIADYSEVIRLEPDFIPAYQNRAAAYEKAGNKAKAKADRDKAAELSREVRWL